MRVYFYPAGRRGAGEEKGSEAESCETESLEKMFPGARIPKLMARLASEGGTRGGQVHPFLLRRDGKTVEFVYLWSDAEFHDPDVIEAMGSHPDFGKLAKMMQEDETWSMLDLRPWGQVFELGTQAVPQLGSFNIPSVHDSGTNGAKRTET